MFFTFLFAKCRLQNFLHVKASPLACIKFCLQNFLRQKGQSLPSSRLPLGGKLSTKLTDEGRCLFSEIRARRQNLGFPLPSSRLPLGGRLLAEQGGEGRSPFLIENFHRIFQSRGVACFSLSKNLCSLAFPFRAGFACFVTDCRLSFVFLGFAFDITPCFPLSGKVAAKPPREDNKKRGADRG